MTIDPADFVAQGAPTVEQVKAVWDTTPYPSARKVAELLNRRGFTIHYRTVARYHAAGWAGKDPVKQAAARKVKADAVELSRELEVIQASVEPPKPDPEPQPDGDAPPPKGTDPIEDAFKTRDTELWAQSENALRKIEAKRRIITNIHLLEAMSRKAHVMILVPKETAAMVTAMTEAADASPSTGKADGLPGDGARDVTPQPHTINGTATRNEQADTIAAFRRKLKTVG